MRLIFYLLAITSCLGNALQAQELAVSNPDTTKFIEEPEYFLDEVIVTAPRVERVECLQYDLFQKTFAVLCA